MMRLKPMSFKNYIWPRNPETVTVERAKNIGKYQVPYEGNVLQDFGMGSRTVKGSGVFWGPECAEEFQQLAKVFAQEGAGQLILPDMAPFPAMFVSLTRKGDPRPNHIGYEFEFLEDGSAPEVESVVSDLKPYCCKEGDTLFSIAAMCGISVDDLLQYNPHIQWPNFLEEGAEVMIP